MKKLVFAIDCDDVLINASEYIVTAYNQLYGTNVQLETAHSSANPAWQADRTEVFRRLHHIQQGEGFTAIPPRSDALEHGVELAIWFGDYPWQTSQEFDEHIKRAGDWIAAERMINDFAG